MQRVPREERGDEQAREKEASQPAQREEQEDGIGCVDENAGEVVSARAQAEELHIYHVRQPTQRSPVINVSGEKRPLHTFPGETPAHHVVREHEDIVIEVHKAEVPHRGEEGQRDRCQQGGPQPPPLGLVAGDGWLGNAHHYGRVACVRLIFWAPTPRWV